MSYVNTSKILKGLTHILYVRYIVTLLRFLVKIPKVIFLSSWVMKVVVLWNLLARV